MFRLGIYTFFVVVLAATAWSLPASDEKNGEEEKYCYTEGLAIKEGENVPAPIGKCHDIRCMQASTDFTVALTCIEWQLAPGSKCRKSEIDLTKRYPYCCPEKICDEE